MCVENKNNNNNWNAHTDSLTCRLERGRERERVRVQESHYDFQVVLILFAVWAGQKEYAEEPQLFTVSIKKKKSRRDYVRYKIKHVPIEMSSLTLMRMKTFSVNLWLLSLSLSLASSYTN